MGRFHYKVISHSGSVVEGFLEGDTKQAVIDRLKEEGCLVLRVEGENRRREVNILARLRRKDVCTHRFSDEMGIFLKAGFTLEESVKVMVEFTSGQFGEVLHDIFSGIREGQALSQMLEKYPSYFPPYYVGMVRAGEEAGNLPEVFERLGAYYDNMLKLQSELFSALIYPTLLFCVGLASVLVLIFFVIPKFSAMFSDMGVPLPLSTRVLLSISHLAVKYSWLGLALALGLVFFLKNKLKDTSFRMFIDEKKFSIPLTGKLLTIRALARITRALGSLLAGGVDLLRSLDIVKDMVGNLYLQKMLLEVRKGVGEGKPLSNELEKWQVFSPRYIEFVKVGERTGDLGGLLLKAAEIAEQELRQRLRRAVALIEPALILFMGLLIGTFVVSMLLGILSINDVVF